MLLTTDRNIRYQQNLADRTITTVVLSKTRWRLIKSKLPEILEAVSAAVRVVSLKATFQSIDCRAPWP